MVYPILLAAGAGALIGTGIAKLWNAEQRRAAIQRKFVEFSDRIKHEQFEERELLRERRQLLTDSLLEALPTEPKARLFTQGSYAMQTGVKPLNGEYDIDIGIEFDCGTSKFVSPIEAKTLVYESLRRGKRRVEVRRSCVTVYYTGGAGLPDHHVDLAVYVKGEVGQLLLAKGKRHSDADKCFWEPSSPELLTSLVRDKYSGEQVAQFRRCVRYLKRWKHVNFTTPAPHSIALTVAAYRWFEPNAAVLLEDIDDRLALLRLVRRLLSEFRDGRLAVALPVPPSSDLLERMTPAQMMDFRKKLEVLEAALNLAGEQETEAAVATLASQFGNDFH